MKERKEKCEGTICFEIDDFTDISMKQCLGS